MTTPHIEGNTDHAHRPLSPVEGSVTARPYDPLKLCVFATIAALGWWTGPVALLLFAVLGFAGYWKARRAGLTHSKCLLGDTRLVLGYLAVLAAVACGGIYTTLS